VFFFSIHLSNVTKNHQLAQFLVKYPTVISPTFKKQSPQQKLPSNLSTAAPLPPKEVPFFVNGTS
jgi:hypothetical protein